VTDIKNMSEKIAMHESSKLHINNAADLAMLDNVNIGTQLDIAYQQSIVIIRRLIETDICY
jgi:hypothetical protein